MTRSSDHKDQPESARRAALLLLGRRDFSSAELRSKLLAKGYLEEAIGAAIEALRLERLLDDGRFLENFVRAHAARGQTDLAVKDLETYLGNAQDALDIDAVADQLAGLRRARN